VREGFWTSKVGEKRVEEGGRRDGEN